MTDPKQDNFSQETITGKDQKDGQNWIFFCLLSYLVRRPNE